MRKSVIRQIIEILHSGRPLSSAEIAAALSESGEKRVEPSDIAGHLKKISDPQRSDLGRFVCRERGKEGYVYCLVPEAVSLSEEQLYGLTLKGGKGRFSLAAALSAVPELRAHVTDADACNSEPETGPETGSDAGPKTGPETEPDTGSAAEPGPKPDPAPLHLAAIGSSAGGLAAIYAFLGAIRPGGRIAYVLINHRKKEEDGDHYVQMIQSKSPVPVLLAQDGMKPEPDHVYIAPRQGLLKIKGDRFTLTPVDGTPDRNLPIDAFFKSLAAELAEYAIGIVLSGMGSDGTAGLREIKAVMGLCLAQSPETAQYSSMPRNALQHVAPDLTLDPAEMPEALAEYVRSMGGPEGPTQDGRSIEQMLPAIYALLKSRTGQDFSGYKTSTISRRVGRRMAVQGLRSARQYAGYLQRNPGEADILFRELLIGVTSFFRDPEAFEALKKELMKALENRPADRESFRVWVAGCSTGEEAYSVAIALRECIHELDRFFDIQIFGTDLSETAVEWARDPCYPKSIAKDVGDDRLKRFFTEEEDAYRVKKEIRDTLVFAVHNLIKDPPFTRLDLICCRNLLIYLDAKVQKRLLPNFHYALRPEGLLFLGTSETVGGFADLFEPVDAKVRLYRRRASHLARGSLFTIETDLMPPAWARELKFDTEDISVRHQRALLRHTAPVSLVVEKTGEIRSVFGRTGLFLELPQGNAAVNNIFRMAKDGLRAKLPSVIRQAVATGKTVHFDHVRVRENGDEHLIRGRVAPLTAEDEPEGLLMVILEDTGPREMVKEKSEAGKDHREVEDVKKELRRARQDLNATVEELETTNEELKSINEEYQSANEELQSSNEELESSKEEQQSLNEELVTLNSELQVRYEQLQETNQQMRSLLENLRVPILFLDADLRIVRFTSQLTDLVKVIPPDEGRAVSDITTNLEGTDLSAVATRVLDTLEPWDEEVKSTEGRWYRMRALPYRSRENVIEGVLISFLDIQERMDALADSDAARRYAEAIFDTVREPLLVLDADLTVASANRSFYETFGLRFESVIGRSFFTISGGVWDLPELRRLLENSIRKHDFFKDFPLEGEFPGLGRRRFTLNTRRLSGQHKDEEKILLAIADPPPEHLYPNRSRK